MLAFNSYGLPRSNNQSGGAGGNHVTLPRLTVGSPHARGNSGLSPFCPAPPRETRSLSKLEVMRRAEQPLYRTTAGYDYGRHLDIPDSALSVPKHARHAAFTHEFNAGPFKDTSLTSIDKSKLRAESWEHKVEERTKLMKIKYEELQEKLEVKKAERKRERESRRREMERRHRAAVAIQARIRGYLVRNKLRKQRLALETKAAIKIQQVFRSRELVKHAKEELARKRRQRLNVYANKLQRSVKKFLLRCDAVRQLSTKRQERTMMASHSSGSGSSSGGSSHRNASSRGFQQQEDAAALVIQRVLRILLSKRLLRSQSTRSTNSSGGSSSSSSSGGDGSHNESNAAGGANSARAKATQQRLARRTIVTLKHRKPEKSQKRLF